MKKKFELAVTRIVEYLDHGEITIYAESLEEAKQLVKNDLEAGIIELEWDGDTDPNVTYDVFEYE